MISARRLDSVAILDICGKMVGGPEAEEFKKAMGDLIAAGYKHVLLNLAEVPWVNSTGLGIFVAGYTSLKREGGSLKLVKVTDRVRTILTVTRLDSIFESFADEAEAVASFRSA
jgi:anti-sigma B factor antagonist